MKGYIFRDSRKCEMRWDGIKGKMLDLLKISCSLIAKALNG